MIDQATSRTKKSPNVPKASLAQRLGLRAVRTGFQIAEVAAPWLGAIVTERLWFTPPRLRRIPDLAPPGEPFTVRVEGRPVAGWFWGEGEPVYLLHGWGGVAAQLGALVEPLVAAGFRVVGFDAPGHGASGPGAYGGRQATLRDFADALMAVVAEHGAPHAVIGHSLGCPATTIAVRDGLSANGLVFIAPAASPVPYLDRMARTLGYGQAVHTRLVRRIERRLDQPVTAVDVVPVGAQVDPPPLLVVHDVADQETSFEGSEAIVAAWPRSRLVPTTGLGHYRILRNPGVTATILDFLSTG